MLKAIQSGRDDNNETLGQFNACFNAVVWLATAACDVEAIKAKAAERAQSSQSTAGKSEGAHLEVACVDLRLVSTAPMVVEGDIIFENQAHQRLPFAALQVQPALG